jgi:uncharacterized membrane protein (Fun14 family)
VEINYADFVLILSDKTMVAINKSQLSTFIRYVNDKGEPQERFLFFSNISADRSIESLCNHVGHAIKKFGLEAKLVGKTYDGAAFTVGHIFGRQKQVPGMYPLTTFTHSYSYVLNILCSKLFVLSKSAIYTYFSKQSQTISSTSNAHSCP